MKHRLVSHMFIKFYICGVHVFFVYYFSDPDPHTAHQNQSVIIAKDFLRRQKQALSERQESLKRVKEEISDSALRQRLNVRLINYHRQQLEFDIKICKIYC